jgi:ERCC4-type nuclease
MEDALKSFRILVDNREQNTPKAVERYAAFGVPYERATLRFGDYAGQITLPCGWLYDTAKPVTARCVVERKMSLEELVAYAKSHGEPATISGKQEKYEAIVALHVK